MYVCKPYKFADENCWVVPPPVVICRVIVHMKICKAFGTLIIPKWKSSLFWPMVWNAKSNNFYNFVLKFIEYKNPKRLFTFGSDN